MTLEAPERLHCADWCQEESAMGVSFMKKELSGGSVLHGKVQHDGLHRLCGDFTAYVVF